MRTEASLIVAILVLALAVRLPGLDAPLWYDEVLLLVTSVRRPLDELVTSYPAWTNQRLYSILAQLSASPLGETPFALRFPALVFGICGISAAIMLVRSLGSKRESLLVGLLLAVSYPAVWHSQNARAYSGLMFFLTAAFLLFSLGWQGRRWVWPWYALLLALGAYLHPFMIAAGASHAMMLALDRMSAGRLWQPPAPGARNCAWVALAAAGALIVLLYAPVAPQIVAHHQTEGIGLDIAAIDPFRSLNRISANLFRPALLLALVPIVLMVVGGIAYGRKGRLVLAMSALVAIYGGVATLLSLNPSLPQISVSLLPIALMLMVRGIDVSARGRGTLVIASLTVLSAASLLLVYRYPKQDFLGAMSYVQQQAVSDASIAGLGPAGKAYKIYYAPEIDCIYSDDEYDRLLDRRRETWMLVTLLGETRATVGHIQDRVLADFRLVATFPGTLDDGSLLVYYRPASSAGSGFATSS